MNFQKFIIVIFIIILLSCNRNIVGNLTDARDYLITKPHDSDHDFTVYTAMKCNLPSGVVTRSGKIYYLIIEPNRLANYSSEFIRIKAKKNIKNKFIIPEKVWIRQQNEWELVLNE